MLLGLARPETRGQWRMKMKSLPSDSRQKSCADLAWGLSVKGMYQQGENLECRAQHAHVVWKPEGWQSLHWLQLGYFTHWGLNSRDSSQPSPPGSCSSVVIFRVAVSKRKCCVHYQWPFTFSYWICPIHKAGYWTYTPLPMFEAIKTCSRTQRCSHNPMDFRGWNEGSVQSLSACSFPCRQPLTWQYEQGKSVNF